MAGLRFLWCEISSFPPTPERIADNVRLPGQKPIAAASLEEPAAPVDPVSAAATPTASTVLVNGEKKAFDAYNIEGSNYFKLRDLPLRPSPRRSRRPGPDRVA